MLQVSILTSEVGNPLPLQVWSPLEMSHCKRLSQDCGVCQCVPENTCQWCEGHGGIFAFFWFRSWKIEVLRKFWKRQCVEKLQGIETETPRRIISSVEDEPSMKVVILGGIRFPLLWFLKKENHNRKVSLLKVFHKFRFDGCETYVTDIYGQIIATKPLVGHPKWWFSRGIPQMSSIQVSFCWFCCWFFPALLGTSGTFPLYTLQTHRTRCWQWK